MKMKFDFKGKFNTWAPSLLSLLPPPFPANFISNHPCIAHFQHELCKTVLLVAVGSPEAGAEQWQSQMWKQPSPAVTCSWEPCRHLHRPVSLYSILWRAPGLLSLLAADVSWAEALKPWGFQVTVHPCGQTRYPMQQHVICTQGRDWL